MRNATAAAVLATSLALAPLGSAAVAHAHTAPASTLATTVTVDPDLGTVLAPTAHWGSDTLVIGLLNPAVTIDAENSRLYDTSNTSVASGTITTSPTPGLYLVSFNIAQIPTSDLGVWTARISTSQGEKDIPILIAGSTQPVDLITAEAIPAGRTANVSAKGFVPNQPVDWAIADGEGQIIATAGPTTANSDGTATVNISTPPNAPVGSYVVAASQFGVERLGTISILDPLPVDPNDPEGPGDGDGETDIGGQDPDNPGSGGNETPPTTAPPTDVTPTEPPIELDGPTTTKDPLVNLTDDQLDEISDGFNFYNPDNQTQLPTVEDSPWDDPDHRLDTGVLREKHIDDQKESSSKSDFLKGLPIIVLGVLGLAGASTFLMVRARKTRDDSDDTEVGEDAGEDPDTELD